MAQPLPIAGWYPDPEHGGQDRWWDGTAWTDTRRPSIDAAMPAPPRGPGLYIPGETVLQAAPAPAFPPTPVVRNNLALIGFILSVSGFLVPVVVNSFAGGIVSIIGLRRSRQLAGTGILSNGRGISIAGILIGFIWGGILLLLVAGFILFELWVLGIATNVQYSDSPVI